MLKKAIVLLYVISVLLQPVSVNAVGSEPVVSAESAVLMIAQTGQIVYEKNAHQKRGMASTTKIMSSLVALEYGNLYSEIRASKNDVSVEGTSLGLRDGDTIDLLSLVKGMLLSSGNDSANVTATLVGGSKSGFVELMNKKAASLGMESTCFKNPSGLTEDGHYSTAYDMALLGSYAIKDSLFRSICSSSVLRISFGNPPLERSVYNHNKLLEDVDGAIGIKTGYTKASGRCLVSAVERNGVILVGVTMNAPDDWNDHKRMFEYGFEVVDLFEFSLNPPDVDVVGSDKSCLGTALSSKIIIPYFKNIPEYSVKVYVPRFLYSGVKSGDCVGCVVLSYGGAFKTYGYLISSTDAPANINAESEQDALDNIKEFLRKGLS